MKIFIDTSAFLAVLNANDHFHHPAKQAWGVILAGDSSLYTSNYVLLETTALLQHRFGLEALRLLQSEILPVIETTWVDAAIHARSTSALLAANRRQLSLVDCTSFEILRQMGLEAVFSFDPHFRQQGFTVIPDNAST